MANTMEYGEVMDSIFETLTRSASGGIAPWLAADFRVEDGGKRYRFRLRADDDRCRSLVVGP